VLSLIGVFVCGSCILFLFGYDFLALLFVIVYVGAIAVLFLFIVIMLDLRIVRFTQSFFNYYLAAFVVLTSVFCEFVFIFSSIFGSFGEGTTGYDWVFAVSSTNSLSLIGELLYTYFFYPFILSSLVLLVSMICSICLTFLPAEIFSKRQQNIYFQVVRRNDLKINILFKYIGILYYKWQTLLFSLVFNLRLLL
jgi:NADH-quinone oxidoreductase subunit J